MSRKKIVAAAQMGPVNRTASRAEAVSRMCDLMRQAASRGASLVVFPELALTTFFPRWALKHPKETSRYFETEMPSPEVEPLFATARSSGIGFYLGYAEATRGGRYFNTSILVDDTGDIVGKYRKIHLPGHAEPEPWRPFQHLEKAYFEKGDLGFPVFEAMQARIGMCLCNDRRWPETWRMLGLDRAELVLLGYNTPVHYPPAPEHDHLQYFHNALSLQAGAYQNGLWVVATAKAGQEDGCDLIGGSMIVAPTGEIAAQATTLGDELVMAEIDLDRCGEIRRNIFDFAKHRQPDEYKRLSEAGP
jgi:N-carbamoyl-D-amino-acid hydrolase